MIATATAHPNIALVKYWGKRDAALNLPAASSLSVTLEGLSTTTRVAFDVTGEDDRISLDGVLLDEGRPRRRVVAFLDLVRQAAELDAAAVVDTTNDFPTASGLASSASGFAALAVAATAAADLDYSPQQLSVLARRGSGSAARSIFGGFVEMRAGSRDDGTDAHAVALSPPKHWDLRCLIALTTGEKKEVGSTEGMNRTQATSPLFAPWRDTVDDDLAQAKGAIADRDFQSLTQIAERSCLRMHATAIGADPGILYWNPTTVTLIHKIRRARRDGLSCFFTIDAGPHVKVFCPSEAADDIHALLTYTDGVRDVLTTEPGGPAQLITADKER